MKPNDANDALSSRNEQNIPQLQEAQQPVQSHQLATSYDENSEYQAPATNQSNKTDVVRKASLKKPLLSFILPFLGWFLGMNLNPEGYMSEPFMAIVVIMYTVAGVVILMPVPMLIALVVTRNKESLKKFAGTVLFIVNVITAVFLFMGTESADDDEFTG